MKADLNILIKAIISILTITIIKIMSKQKQKSKKVTNKMSQKQQRASEQFFYNDQNQRYIGKRTGNYFYRIQPKQNFDGFPRFSQYQSHRNTQSSSLARELNRNSASVSNFGNKKQQRGRLSVQISQPFQAKQSPILIPMQSSANTSSRIPQGGLPGFGQYAISTIKRRDSHGRPSQFKSYKDLLNQLETEQFKQFIFNEQQMENIVNSAKKQREKDSSVQQISNSFFAKESKKKVKKQNRVSFDNRQIEQQFSISFENSKIKKQQINVPEESNLKIQPRQYSIRIKPQKREPKEPVNKQLHFKITKQQIDSKNTDSKQNQQIVEQNLKVQQIEKQTKKRVGKKVNRKKQLRINFVQQEIKQSRSRSKKEGSVKRQQKSQTKSKKKETKYPNQSRKRSRSKKVKQVKNQYVQQLISDAQEESQDSGRYPRRTRVKPVQYWQNQKVHYKCGKVIGIDNAQISLEHLLKTNQKFENTINVNFHNHDLQIEVMLPAKKQFISQGFREPYQTLQIQLKKIDSSIQQLVYFDDGARSQKLKQNSILIIQPLTYFQISNKNNFTTRLLMRLKVQVS